MKSKSYIAIDLKSFYASIECVERNLDPLTTNLVVADESRTEKTICLAVSPTLKSYGIKGRPRLFEVIQQVNKINEDRKRNAPNHLLYGSSYDYIDLVFHKEKAVSYLVAPPRMALYMDYSTRIYEIYLKYIAPEDIHVYSIDEVFIDATKYINLYQMDAKKIALMLIKDVFQTTGITATAGIGTNLYLAKVAMDIVAKKMKADKNGVRIAELDEIAYRKLLWSHTPITDFWRVGSGYAKRLATLNLTTMGDIARFSLQKEEILYQQFGKNAELLIDHAWGFEPCTIEDIKSYQPSNHSVGSGQVLACPYSYEKARIVIYEMADMLALQLVEKGLVTNQIVVTIGYDRTNLSKQHNGKYHGEIVKDRYGREIPKHAHGTRTLSNYTSSSQTIVKEALQLFDTIIDPSLFVRRLYITAAHTILEANCEKEKPIEQMDLFVDYQALQKQEDENKKYFAKEKQLQKAIIQIKHKYGKNAVLKGTNLQEGATTKDRNNQIGGHKA